MEFLQFNGIKYPIETIFPIPGISLRRVSIINSSIKSLEEIEGIFDAKIESLELGDNISSLSGVENLNKLENLTLKGNKIQRIENIESLTNLKRLNLAHNEIKKIENLNGLNLYNLRLDWNQISEIENLDSLANLGSLDLSSNNISEIKGLDNLKKLWKLNLADNKITEIKGLSKLSNIQEVLLMENQINHITGIESIKFGTKLALGRNPIPKDQLDCFRYHHEIYPHERGDEMGDILFQVMETNRAKELLDLLISYWDDLENVELDSPEDNEPYLRLERERLTTRSEIWKIKTKQPPEYAQVPAESALKYSTLSSEGMKMIKDIDKIQIETLDKDILKIFILQAKILLKRSSFYKFNRNNPQKLAKMAPFFTRWDEKLREFIDNFQQ